MTKDEMIETGVEDSPKSRPILGQVLFFLGISLAGGGLAAGIAITAKDGLNIPGAVVTGVLLLIGLAMIAGAVKVGDFEPPSTTSRTGRAQLILLVCVILGALLGMYITISGATDRMLAGNFSLSQTEAIVALVLLFAVLLPTGLYWQREIDEHERSAAKDAGYIALNVYIYGYLAMMIAASGGLIPWIHGSIVFFVVLFVFLFGWMVKRAG